DLPEPESPVTTMRLSRGISSDMFFRLCTRAPCTAMVVRAAVLVTVREAIPWLSRIEERELLDFDVAFSGQTGRGRSLADEPLIGEVLARQSDAADVEIPFEVIFDLSAGSRLARLTQMLNHHLE